MLDALSVVQKLLEHSKYSHYKQLLKHTANLSRLCIVSDICTLSSLIPDRVDMRIKFLLPLLLITSPYSDMSLQISSSSSVKCSSDLANGIYRKHLAVYTICFPV